MAPKLKHLPVLHSFFVVFSLDAVAFADKAPSPDRSANLAKIRDAEIANMIRDHLALNSTVVVTWESSGKAVVNGSKTEGAGVLLVESMGYRYLTIRGAGASQNVAVRAGFVFACCGFSYRHAYYRVLHSIESCVVAAVGGSAYQSTGSRQLQLG